MRHVLTSLPLLSTMSHAQPYGVRLLLYPVKCSVRIKLYGILLDILLRSGITELELGMVSGQQSYL